MVRCEGGRHGLPFGLSVPLWGISLVETNRKSAFSAQFIFLFQSRCGDYVGSNCYFPCAFSTATDLATASVRITQRWEKFFESFFGRCVLMKR